MNPAGARCPMEEEAQPSLLTIPPEMFCKILDYLKEDPRDILNISMTCTRLRDLLQKEDDLAACRLEESIPLVLKWLKPKDIFICRGICKRVAKSVNKALDHIQLISPLENLGLFPRLISPKAETCHEDGFEWRHLSMLRGMLIIGLSIDSVEDMADPRRDVEERKISTLVGKSISFSLPWTEDDDPPRMDPPDYLDKALALLNLDLLRLNIHQLWLYDWHHEDIDDPRVMYEVIRRLMSSLPNLRCLLACNFPLLSEAAEDAGAGLQRFIAEGRSLPRVPLERLSIFDYPVMATLFREIARAYSGTLRALVIWLWDKVSESEAAQWQEEEDYHFPALLELLVWNVTLDWLPILDRIRADNLKRLSWNVRIDSRPSPVPPLTLVVRTVQRFPLLVTMRLQFDMAEGAEQRWVVLEELRHERHVNLKHLVVANYWFNIPLRFFAGLFPNLESIAIDCDDAWGWILQRWPTIDPDMELCRERRFEESGLWDQLPNLNNFRFDCLLDEDEPFRYKCSGAEAEAFRNQN